MAADQLKIDSERGARAAALLHRLFSTAGIHGSTEMPEDTLPAGMVTGSVAHVMFITLTVAIDYQRDAVRLWRASRIAYSDPLTRYLFDPAAVFETPATQMDEDLQKHAVSKKPQKDGAIWRTVAATFLKKWRGDPRNFLADCSWDALTVLQRLRDDQHPQEGRWVKDYPYLSGEKIGPLWLRMLRDNVGETRLKGLDRVPIPVDVHVARATFALGIVRGRYHGPLKGAFDQVRRAWFQAVKGGRVEGRDMIALDIDEPLWHLSKSGCTTRDQGSGSCPASGRCEVRDLCVPGRIIVKGNSIDLDT